MTTSNSGALADSRRALLEQLLADEGLVPDNATGIPKREDRERAPISFAQEVLWLLDRASSPNAAYNTALARRIRGPLDVVALETALRSVTARHDALRTVFIPDGDTAVQRLLPVAHRVLRVDSVASLPAATRERAAVELLSGIAATPFDLVAEPPFRAALVELAADDRMLLLLTHHIASDAWSYSVLLDALSNEYAAAVAGRGESIPPGSELQFGDFAAWQRATFQGAALETRLRYWREQLAGRESLDLPTDFEGGDPRDSAGACVRATLPREDADRLRALAAEYGATMYMVLLAAFNVLLQRYSGQDDIVVGSAVAGRVQPETQSMIGYFSQALPLRTRLDGDPSFAQLVGRVADTVLGAFEHQDVPVETLALELRRSGAPPDALFRVVLTMQDALTSEFRAPGLTVTPVDVETGETKFDVTLLVSQADGAIDLALWYRTALFERATAERMLAHLGLVLDHAVDRPHAPLSTLELLTADDRAALDPRRMRRVDLGTRASMCELVAEAVARDPDATIVRGASATLTAAQLWRAAGVLARRIIEAGGGECVVLDLDRSAEAVVGMLAIWRAGAAYVPISADWPSARRAEVVRQSGARVAITSAGRSDALSLLVSPVVLDSVEPLLSAPEADGPAIPSDADSLAYVLFTSGSTGTPKGVEVTHANAVHYTRAIAHVLARTAMERDDHEVATFAGRRFALASSLTADLGNTTVFLALAAGGVLEIFDPAETTEPAAFAARMRARPVDVMKLTPNHLAALIADAEGPDLASLLPTQWLILGGELLRVPIARRILGAGRCALLNHYGPTEATVGACAQIVTLADLDAVEARGSSGVPIGVPLANVGACVVDVFGNEQPPGIPGELVLFGAGIARGYRGLEDRTRERFVRGYVRAAGGKRAYRTGDRVRWHADSGIEFLGRHDDQIKIRGFRVELGEIEQVLSTHPLVERAVVAVAAGNGADPELAAWLVLRPSAVGDTFAAELTDWLGSRLPAYMVPRHIRRIDAIPLAPNGKVDRAALRSQLVGDDGPRQAGRAPIGEVETAIAAIWTEVLRRDGITATDNFLELGGQSLLAIRVLGKLSRTFGVRLPLRTLFESPTIEQLAVALETAKHGDGRA